MSQKNPPPNLLFVFTDEQRWDTLGVPGIGADSMPRLNQFLEHATLIEEAYCTQPVCTPSRGSIMTGLYPHSHGATFNNIDLNEDAQCIPELLDSETREKYRTAYIGKWHLGDEIYAQHGFDEWISLEDNYRKWYSEGRDKSDICDHNVWLRENGFLPDNGDTFSRDRAANLPADYTKAAFVGGETCRFLEENGDKPFIAYANFLEPHMPFHGPLSSQFDPKTLPMPENFDAPPGEDHHPQYRIKAESQRRRGFKWYDFEGDIGWRQLAAAYYGLCKLVDIQVGKILDTLESKNLLDNTIIVFTSDHGEMLGSHRLLTKGFPYQESARVPLAIRVPGQSFSHRISGPFSQIDLVPTLLDLMGQPEPDHLHGKSISAYLDGQEQPLQDDIFFYWNQPNRPDNSPPDWALEMAGGVERYNAAIDDATRTIITPEGWRYTHSLDLGHHELFNLKEDPLERRNRVADSSCNPIRRDLQARISAWQERVGDPRRIDGEPLTTQPQPLS